jgi:uncharacterized protein DUF3592
MKLSHDPITWAFFLKDVAVGIVAAGGAFMLWKRRQSARHWPQAHGTVQFAECIGYPKGLGERWVVDVYYSYMADGEYYSGQHQLPASGEDRAHEMCREMKGQGVSVRYSRKAPAISVLLADDQMSFLGEQLQART